MTYNWIKNIPKFKMDGKKTKRRKSNGGKRHGSMEEKPKSTEVMNEKEKQDRLEAASALSSLMFLPPLSSAEADDDESSTKVDQDTPSSTISHNLRSLSSLPGIPNSLNITPRLPKLGRPPKSAARDDRNNAILAELENKLNLSMNRDNKTSVVTCQTHTGVKYSRLSRTNLLSSPLPLTLPHTKLISKQLPLTVIPQTQTVNRDVAKALRNAVSKNAVKIESDRTLDNSIERQDERHFSPSMPTVTQEVEKMEGTLSSVSLKKKDNSDTNLPLKKRRLVGVMNASSSNADSLLSETNMNSCVSYGTLATGAQIDNILQMENEQLNAKSFNTNSLVAVKVSDQTEKPDEGYRPVEVDPRTSLMVLSDLKFALTPDEDGDLPLHIAVVHEDTELVKKFVDIMLMSGKTVDRFNKLQQTPLHLAILVNKPDIVKALLSAGANPNHLDRHGCTSVHSSVRKQFDQCMEAVFQATKFDLNLNCRDYQGYYPLHTCVELDNLRMLMELVNHGADINSQDGKAGRSVLMYAVEYNRCKIGQYLLENGANAELQNYAGVTPMMIAQAGKMDEMLNHLNKALDIGRGEEQQYMQTKKVPISRIPSRTDFSDPKTRHSMSLNGVPLVYEEYERLNLDSNSQDGRPTYSRQSSTSSPIDLSMRGISTQTPSPAAELSRGRPPRKKGKKESKNHKEKHSQKSNVIEKHASLVAALESKAVVEKSSAVQSDKVIEAKHNGKDVIQDKSSAMNFLLNLNPVYAQQLLEKMGQAYGFRLNPGSEVRHQPGALKDHKEDCISDKVQNSDTMQVDTNAEVSRNDIDTSSKFQTLKDGKCVDVESEHINEKIVGNSSELNEKKTNNEEDMESGIGVSNESDSYEIPCDVISDKTNNEKKIGEPMDEAESPAMPVLSRATSECQETDENAVEDLNKSSAPSVSNSPVPVVNKVTTEHDGNNKQDYTLKTDQSMDAKPETEVTTSKDNSSKDFIDNIDNNSKIEDDRSVLSENAEVVNKDSDNVSVNERSDISSVDSYDVSDKLRNHLLHKHSDQSEQSRSTSKIVQNTLNTRVLVDRSDKLEESHIVYSDHSDDSMEVDISDIVESKISGNNEKYNFSETVKNTLLDGNESKMDNANVRSSIEEKTLVMDLDEDRESGLVIDENISDDGNTPNDNSESIGEFDEAGCKEVIAKSGVRENAADIDLQATEMVVKDGINKEELVKDGSDKPAQTKKSSESSKETDPLLDLQGKSESVNISSEMELASDILKEQSLSDVNKQIPEKFSSKTSDSSSNHSSSEPVTLVDNLLKTGQSHVLFYHDGDKYKPVRIFIDNSEQSSKVLKQMIQSAQFSTLDASSTSTQLDDKVSTTLPSELTVPIKRSVNIEHPKGPIDTSGVNDDKHKTAEELSTVNNNTKSTLPSNGLTNVESNKTSFQNAYIQSLNTQIGTETRKNISNSKVTKSTKRKSSPGPWKPDTVPNKSHSDYKHKKTVEGSDPSKSSSNSTGKSSVSNTETVSKSVPSAAHVLGKKVSGTHYTQTKPAGVAPPKALYNEGTLTRVNPDIKSRLSKALQSSSRKMGLDKGDSESFSNGSRGFEVKCIPVETITTIAATSDSRQQL